MVVRANVGQHPTYAFQYSLCRVVLMVLAAAGVLVA